MGEREAGRERERMREREADGVVEALSRDVETSECVRNG